MNPTVIIPVASTLSGLRFAAGEAGIQTLKRWIPGEAGNEDERTEQD